MKNRLKELRAEYGITQSVLAKKIGIAQNTLSYWEQGKYDIDTDSLRKIANFFECSIDYILGFENAVRTKTQNDFFVDLITDKEKQLIIAYRKNTAMQPAIDKILGINENEDHTPYIAAYDGNTPDNVHLSLKNIKKLDDEN